MFLVRAMRDMLSAKSKKVIDENVCPIVLVGLSSILIFIEDYTRFVNMFFSGQEMFFSFKIRVSVSTFVHQDPSQYLDKSFSKGVIIW